MWPGGESAVEAFSASFAVSWVNGERFVKLHARRNELLKCLSRQTTQLNELLE